LLVHDTTYPDLPMPDLLKRPKVAAEQPTGNSQASEIVPPLASAPAGGPQIITWPTSESTRSEEPLVAALRYLLDNKADKAVDSLKKYGKQNQELLLQLLPVMVEVSQTNFNKAGSRAYTNLAQNLERAREPLVPRADLQIDKMVYCERIKDFGRYMPLEDKHVFRPSTSKPYRLGDLVQVYVELNNLASIQRPGSKCFETRVASTVDIRTLSGKICWYYDFNDRRPGIVSQTQRHDFYNNYSFYVPDIPAGRYILTIHITDCITQRVTARSLPFLVATLPPPRLVSAR
jgi:hypothetical protein